MTMSDQRLPVNDTSRHDKPALPAKLVISDQIVERCVQANWTDRPDVQLDAEDLELLRHDIRVTLEAAAPAIRDQATAAERQRIVRQLRAIASRNITSRRVLGDILRELEPNVVTADTRRHCQGGE
jgi:hypothetical protein